MNCKSLKCPSKYAWEITNEPLLFNIQMLKKRVKMRERFDYTNKMRCPVKVTVFDWGA